MARATPNPSVEFFVPGIPRPFARPRPGKYGGFHNPEPYASWKKTVEIMARKVRASMVSPIPAPYQVTAIFYLPTPKKPGKGAPIWPHISDLDNLLKGICDGIQDLKHKKRVFIPGMIDDDVNVVAYGPTPPLKKYADGHPIGAKIIVSHFPAHLL